MRLAIKRRSCRLLRSWRQQSHDHNRYVVKPATIKSQREHVIASCLGASRSRVLQDLVVPHVSGQAIAADHEDILRLGRACYHLKFRIIGDYRRRE
ncbi:hypothetical protein ABIF41_001973 [Bradyrhizobium japonicum]